VSVVIPTFNRAHTIGAALSSVLDQEFADLECLVVDDGSTDDTAAVVAGFQDPRVRYIAGRHAGVSAARNLGVGRARGDIIAFLDSDDLWRRDKLGRDVSFLRGHPDVDAVFTDLEKHDGGAVYSSFMRQTAVFSTRLNGHRKQEGVPLSQREMFLVLLQEVPIKPSALTIRRAAFEATGGFDESWSSSEDWEFLLRFARARRFGYIDQPLAVLRVGRDSLHRLDQERGETAMIRLLHDQRAVVRDDGEARDALRRGLIARVKHFGWHYRALGRRGAAARVLLNGFRLTGSPGLLLRAIAALLLPY
jgi:glycosyltransferase involved in cell wall biosynthesis